MGFQDKMVMVPMAYRRVTDQLEALINMVTPFTSQGRLRMILTLPSLIPCLPSRKSAETWTEWQIN